MIRKMMYFMDFMFDLLKSSKNLLRVSIIVNIITSLCIILIGLLSPYTWVIALGGVGLIRAFITNSTFNVF